MATKEKLADSKDLKVKPHDEVTIEYTENAAFHQKGERSTVHRYLAGKLEKKGVAKIVKE